MKDKKIPTCITLKPDTVQGKMLNELLTHFDFKTYSKTIFKCVSEFLHLQSRLDITLNQNKKYKKEIEALQLQIQTLEKEINNIS